MLIRQNQATSEVSPNKKTTPDLSIVKRLGGSRTANIRTILQLYAIWKPLNEYLVHFYIVLSIFYVHNEPFPPPVRLVQVPVLLRSFQHQSHYSISR